MSVDFVIIVVFDIGQIYLATIPQMDICMSMINHIDQILYRFF